MRWRDFDALPLLPDEFFQIPRRVHFVGVGGIGMSALAFVLKSRGHQVSGSDAHPSVMLQKLQAAGIETVVGHSAQNLDVLEAGAEAIIWGSAIAPDNPERLEAERRAIPQWHRAQLLAFFVNNAKVSIAVSGTHGKSTTSAMIAHILDKCGQNPTAILGAVYPPFDSNVRMGSEDLVVVEADESDGSFTLLKPTVAVVTNVEPEHLENYDDSEDELWRAFEMFAEGAQRLVLNADGIDWSDDAFFLRLDAQGEAMTYAVGDIGELRAVKLQAGEGRTTFELKHGKKSLGTFAISLAGEHNVSNALAAISAALTQSAVLAECNVVETLRQAARALADFHGIARRFEFKGEASDILIYDDYGHHPTEVRATLEAARDFLKRPVTLIFQPHRYSRTAQMGRDFGPAFEAADRVIITQLYSAFETPIEGISGRIVFDALRESFPDKPAFYAENLDEARHLALEIALPGDALLTMGAGDVGTLGPLLLQDLRGRA